MIDETQWGPLSHDSEKKPTVGEEILGLLLIYWWWLGWLGWSGSGNWDDGWIVVINGDRIRAIAFGKRFQATSRGTAWFGVPLFFDPYPTESQTVDNSEFVLLLLYLLYIYM